MSWGDDVRDVSRPADRARFAALIDGLDADELRLLLLLAERILARRPQPGRLEVAMPRDAAGDVAASVELAVDLALAATTALTWVRRHQT